MRTKMTAIDNSKSLSHHGILKQKWGVRNGPPYPLDDSISTGSQLIRKRKDRGVDPKDPRSPESKTRAKVNDLRVNMKNMSDEELSGILRRLDLEIKVEKLYKDQIDNERKERERAKEGRRKSIQSIIDGVVNAGKFVIKGTKLADNYLKSQGEEGLYEQLGLGEDFDPNEVFNLKSKKKKND